MLPVIEWSLRRTAFIVMMMAVWGASAKEASADDSRVITDAASIRSLTPEVAGKSLPVRLRGVVTFFDPERRTAFLQDHTGGIFFFPGRMGEENAVVCNFGDFLEVDGFTLPGGYAPIVEGPWVGQPASAKLIRKGLIPEPVPLPWSQMGDDRNHNRFVTLRGVARSMEMHGSHAQLQVSTAGGMIKVILPPADGRAPDIPAAWLNEEAEWTGVFSVVGNERRERSELRLYIQNVEQISPDIGAVEDAFSEEPRRVEGLMRFDPEGRFAKRVHVEGEVLHRVKGRGFYLRADRGLWVETPQQVDVAEGDRVGVAGYVSPAHGRATVVDAIVRRRSEAPAPSPVPVTVEQARTGRHHGDLVRIFCELIESSRGAKRTVWILRADGRQFRAEMPVSSGTETPIDHGSLIGISGICLNEPASGAAAGTGLTDFSMLVRTPSDIVVLREASWWKPWKVVMAAAGVLVVVGIIFFWGMTLRRQVKRQTALIQEKLEREVVWEERNRIARELHDTVQQQLVGVKIALDTASARVRFSDENGNSALRTAQAILRHTSAEARRSIWDLRSHSLEQNGLVAALNELAVSERAPGAPEILVAFRGTPARWPAGTEFHLYRIAQEAISNALKHAQASRIKVLLVHGGDSLMLVVSDDGCGFVPDDRNVAGDRHHFGLMGMKERAGSLRATFDIRSQLGGGTRLVVNVPLEAGKTIP